MLGFYVGQLKLKGGSQFPLFQAVLPLKISEKYVAALGANIESRPELDMGDSYNESCV